MREMKDSGIAWIGEIPKEWEVGQVKHCFYRKNEKCKIENPVVLSLARSGVKVRDISTNEGQIAESYFNYNPVEPLDLLLNPMDLYSGANCSISKEFGVISPAYINLRFKGNNSPRYFDYYFKTQYWSMAFFAHGKGISFDNRWTMNAETIFKYNIPIPSCEEQQLIANFLDKKCGEIDEMVSLQEKIIEELKAYKQSVITEAVTKGLNRNVKMKDSGVDWIGDIPEHWGIPSISHLASISSGSTPNRNNQDYWMNGNINWIKTGELQNNLIFQSEEKITEIAMRETPVKLYPIDTLLIAMYGQGKTRGMTALLKSPSTTNQACAALVVFNKNVEINFLWKSFQGAYDAIRENAVGTGQPNLNAELIAKFRIPLPPLDEQRKIVEHLDVMIPKIDSLISIKQKKIEELKGYKKSLIYEYVTGKKQVV